MRLKIFTIPIYDGDEGIAELDSFLASHRVVSIDKNFIDAGTDSAWSICVTYMASDRRSDTKRTKIDYREILSPAEFAVFARMRTLRKTMAEEQSVPPYALFTNDHLAKMVQQRVASLKDLQTLDGIGEARAEKYGQRFLDLLAEASLAAANAEGADDEA